MIGKGDIQDGMGVFGADAKRIGTVEATSADDFQVNGQQISRSLISRIAHDRVYMKGKSSEYPAQA
jgi:hypothetical protein